MTTPVVTALRARGAGRVAVELDRAHWRVVPLEAVVVAGLAVGCDLDRVTARALGRELRRLDARSAALRALRARDHTGASLERRLEARGTAPTLRRETVAAATRAGLVDDARFASGRAALLAERGAGDLLIADDLERQGVPPGTARSAIEALEPEAERAGRLVAARGRSARTLRFLGAKGFSEETLEALVADLGPDGLG
jgi:SOS response regulatory protein OraA/RecX